MGCSQSKSALNTSSALVPTTAPVAPPQKVYLLSSYSIDDSGVVLYHITSDDVVATKRFTDFKLFHQEMSLLIEDLPPLPEAGLRTYLRRHDVAMIEARRERFQEFINYVVAFDDEILNAALEVFCALRVDVSDDADTYE
ncbi:hypothetical protein SPRG_11195 [Saprolegnia parasitica CBS 223.65]|uniref:PX domain-containing protein n=1 Tax=Saprolegnia parasitica (strain CBS 223.65) TaxID=695850 RepID=A0A067C2B6_SAPPC|nr:hypothetical protein SPRG_11195 [Saprolegnia parasitica CBS 223.65]KDO23265.1 hypothetical protein SPRG_11195 [Saprolegnia parasitica CBS 223.65]|eukprot:XP_012206053.1 hypothetical protein SPRG_11195 [Saprolegnia parasitica CBS 223.65]